MIPACLVRSIRALSLSAFLLSTVLHARAVKRPAAKPAPHPASDLKAGVAACEAGNYETGVSKLRAFAHASPALADYTAYQTALCLAGEKRFEEAVNALAAVWRMSPSSPLTGKAALLAAQSHLDAGAPTKAREVLRAHWGAVAQPEGELLLAKSLDAMGDGAGAAVHYQKVYFDYPASASEKEAAVALDRLRGQLGEKYPPALPSDMFERAELLIQAKDYTRARRELESWAEQFGGDDRDLAQVRSAAVRLLAGDASAGCSQLRSLPAATGEIEAERQYYLGECARRDDSDDGAAAALDKLERDHAQSPWRLKALVSAGNRYLVRNEPERYAPYYRACYASFPDSPRADYCHWKVAWSEYLRHRQDAAGMLREHLTRFPKSDHSPAALYFLARMEENAGKTGTAKALYLKLRTVYPASYYRTLAQKKLREDAIASAAAESAPEWTSHLVSPTPNPLPEFKPDAASRARIERARQLEAAGFSNWAETELRFGANHSGQAYVLAMELARTAARRNAPPQSISYIKALARGYLTLALEDAPDAFWRLAFPLPYRALVERNAAANKLDPYLVAGLIRQESVFDAKALSRSNAMGLTQVMPATGKQLGRKLGIKRFRTAMLYRPDINLKLGTYYLRAMLDQFDDRPEPTLAAYNAGASRAKAWLGWGEFREPAEFVETIPFTETRNYVQIVLRNAETYRALYAASRPAAKPVKTGKRRR